MSKQPNKWSEAREKARRALAAMSDEEDAAITADALADPDNPPADDLHHVLRGLAFEEGKDHV